MSGLDSLLDHLRRGYAAINDVEEVAARSPGDRFVLANLTSLKRDVAKLEAQWEDECRNAHIEVCKYRIQSEEGDSFKLSSVSKSLLDFQELFSQIYDALTNGIKKRARITDEINSETSFDFGFSYPGSLGVALMVPSPRNLLSGKFDQTVDAFLQIMTISNQAEVRELAKSLGIAVVKKTFDWSKENYYSKYNIDITWNTVDGTKKGGLINNSSLGQIVDLIGMTSDISEADRNVRGSLVGIDTVKKKFRFVEADGVDYAGNLSEQFPLEQQWAVNSNYRASIKVKSKTEYATQETKNTYFLMGLIPVSNSN